MENEPELKPETPISNYPRAVSLPSTEETLEELETAMSDCTALQSFSLAYFFGMYILALWGGLEVASILYLFSILTGSSFSRVPAEVAGRIENWTEFKTVCVRAAIALLTPIGVGFYWIRKLRQILKGI